MNAKEKGARREHQARAILEATGYHVVKAGGSLGVFDLVALGLVGARLVQVESNENPVRQSRSGWRCSLTFPTPAKRCGCSSVGNGSQ
jgi:hypothetical protein